MAVAIPFTALDADEVAKLLVGHATVLHSIEVSNIDATDVFIQLFDEAAAGDVTVGTTVRVYFLGVPAGNATVRGMRDAYFDPPLKFEKGIVYAATTTPNGNTAGATSAQFSASYGG